MQSKEAVHSIYEGLLRTSAQPFNEVLALYTLKCTYFLCNGHPMDLVEFTKLPRGNALESVMLLSGMSAGALWMLLEIPSFRHPLEVSGLCSYLVGLGAPDLRFLQVCTSLKLEVPYAIGMDKELGSAAVLFEFILRLPRALYPVR